MSARLWRFLLGVLGLIGFGVMFFVGRKLKPDNPFGWGADVLAWLSALVFLASLLWGLLRTAGRCIFSWWITGKVRWAWIKVLTKSGFEAEPLVLAFQKRYAEEEVKDISGKNQGKYFIVTNFVAYSGLVSKIVHAAYNNCPAGSDVVCFTTLTMPLSKWFNYYEIQNSTFCYCQAHTEWEKYTRDLRELVNSIKIRRCVLAVTDNLANQNKTNPEFAFKGETEMRKHCNYWMLVPTQLNSLGPVQSHQISTWFANVFTPLKTDLKLYQGVDSAYLILPDTKKQKKDLPTPQEYEWLQLGNVFLELFHSQPQADNARCKVLTNTEWHQYFSSNLSEVRRMPEDLFIVGFRPKNSIVLPRWVLCLAGDIDKKLDKLALEFVSDSLNNKRFELITGYVNWLYKESSNELQNWLV